MHNEPASSLKRSSQQQLQEVLILCLLVYNTFVGGSTYGLLIFYPRLVTQVLYVGLIAWWLIHLIRQRRPFPRTPLDWPLMLLGGIILLSTIFSIEPRLSADDIPLYFLYVMTFYMVIDRLRAGWRVSSFVKGLVMTTTVVCTFAGLEYLAWYFGLPAFPTFKQGWWAIGGWQEPIPPTLHRLSYTLNNANILASLLASILPIGLAVAVAPPSRWTRLNAIAWAMVHAAVLLLTFSRGGLLALLTGLLALILILGIRWKLVSQSARWVAQNLRWSLLLAAGILALAWLILPITVQTLKRPEGLSIRSALWHYALKIIRNYPVLGTGPRTFGASALEYWDPAQHSTAYVFNTAHNVLLHAGAEIGITGALIIGLIALLVVRAGYRQATQLPFRQSVLMSGVLSGLAAFAAHNAVDNLLAVPAVVLPVVVMAAICCAQPGKALPSTHPGLTPKRALLLTASVAGLVGGSLYSQVKFEDVVIKANAGEWASAADKLDDLPRWVLPASLYHFERGLVYGKLAQADPAANAATAITEYQDGLAAMGQYVPGRANLAGLYWRSGDLANAQRHLQLAIAQEPSEILYRLNLGLLYEEQGEEEAAIATYAQILADSPHLAESVFWQETDWRRRNWPLIRDEAEANIDEKNIMQKGVLAYYSADLDRAADLFGSVVNEPDLTDSNLWLARTLVAQKRYQQALSVLQYTEDSKGSAQFFIVRGRAYQALGYEAEAIRDLRTAIFLGDSRAQYYLGHMALDSDDIETATHLYRQSLSEAHNLAQTNLRYDFLIYRRGGILDSNLLPQATLPPSAAIAETYLELVDLYIAQGKFDTAKQICQQLLALSPGYRPAQQKLQALSSQDKAGF